MLLTLTCIFLATFLKIDSFSLKTKHPHQPNLSFHENWNLIKPRMSKNHTIREHLHETGSSSRVILEHPTRPMRNGDHEIFKINRAKHPNCQLKENMYHVKKVEDKQVVLGKHSIIVVFTAAVGWISGENQKIGHSSCSLGWITDVEVEQWARGCGIATILTELCLIDPDINNLQERANTVQNKSIFMLGNYPVTLGHIRDYCNALIGMIMLARPLSGAHAYFNAALRQGYNRMLVFSQTGGLKIHYLWVQDAKRLYQSDGPWKGWIGNEFEGCPHCSSCGAIEAWRTEWFFCKDT